MILLFSIFKNLSKTESTMKIEYTIEQWLAIRMIETHHNDQHGREMLPLIGYLLCKMVDWPS